MENLISLALTTSVVAKLPDADWQFVKLETLLLSADGFKVMAWTGTAVCIADATATVQAAPTEVTIYKVTVGGVKYRCAPGSFWPLLKRDSLVSLPASEIKAGDRVLLHPRVGKDALHNLVGHQRYDTATIAQVKSARELSQFCTVSVSKGGPILLGTGVFCG